ncbi:uncharacterized protein LOC106168944 [Lingula anatina]|uniref:Uncharacterized protein LOC106168944 n=1 Tax=Lingula anatina TaxID=7574 RepID=A0A1S3J1G8_LINAN|nr:uncharacterized protein LOC106168944 [Lingula anatina]|eukprot:XP_013403659.1 uncharacterized protein LOC106168944 [Lingula anatina]
MNSMETTALIRLLLGLVLIAMTAIPSCSAQCHYDWPEYFKNLTTCPRKNPIENGTAEYHIKCNFHGPENVTLRWYRRMPFDPDGYNDTLISPGDNTSHIQTFQDGRLIIRNTKLADSGDYVCKTADLANEALAVVKVFVMPDYILESIIIGTTLAVCMAIWLTCTLTHHVKQQKQFKKLKALTENVR